MPQPPIILLAFANDREGEFLRNISEEHRVIKQALIPLVDRGLLIIEELPSATADDIFDAFRKYKDRIQVFHYGGHAQDLELLLNGAEKSFDVVSFAEYLSHQQGLKLVFINGCATAAQQIPLQKAGIPWLILTDTAINDSGAKNFAEAFYQNLASGREVDRAFAEASASVSAQSGGKTRSLTWTFPETQSQAELPWQLFRRGNLPWKLNVEVPFPWRKVLLVFSVIIGLALTGWGVWRYMSPFDMKVALQLPEGSKESHFSKEIMHNLILEVDGKNISSQISPDGFAYFSGLTGSFSPVTVQLHSPYWELADTLLQIRRNPQTLHLKWISRLKTIRGRVSDIEGPLDQVNISLETGTSQTQTNRQGEFTLEIPSDEIHNISHTLILTKPGYQTYHFTANPTVDQHFFEFDMEKE